MHDIRTVRDDASAFDRALARRAQAPVADALLALDRTRRDALTALQEKQARRNAASREIGAGRRDKRDTSALEAEVVQLKTDMEALETAAAAAETELRARLLELPNLPDPAIPDGPDETANLEQKRWGTPRETGFPPLQHFELGENLHQMSFDDAARIAGARFVVLRGALARLERALGQFMLDLHVAEHGFTETSVPVLVNEAAMFGTGQLPKFRDEAFVTTDGRWLAPTSEVPLTNLVAGRIIPDAELPIRMTALTQCFRSEAGSAGRDTRGMLRQHQFAKVEMVSIVRPDESDAEHERMTRAAETVLERLELPYRRMLLCAGDTGFASARTHDLEVWLPGQGTYREVSSISNIRDFQARRMNARTRPPGDAPVSHVHTLNGSGLAIGRTLIAVLENHQQQDGSIFLPAALHPYMAGQTSILPLA